MTITEMRRRLDAGETTSRALCEAALERASDRNGEGPRTFTELETTGAVAAAEAADLLRAAGVVLSPLAGIPVSVKDLFDVAGRTTRAGSLLLATGYAASEDATIVRRLRRAGAVIVGKTNMTEFAYSGLGINPHYGTPRNPWDRPAGRIPGGSSSGAAVSVSDGMAAAGIGTDTGGSVRIPAALCGLVGFKPTARRVPLGGTYPLSPSLDSIGAIAATVQDCMLVDAVLSGEDAPPAPPRDVRGLMFLAPTNYVREQIDAHVASVFTRALDRLRDAGATVIETDLPVLDEVVALQHNGGLPAAEAYWWHRHYLEAEGEQYDPQIAKRIRRGKALTAVDYIELVRRRGEFIAKLGEATLHYDALLWPTVPIVAPTIAELIADDDRYGETNLLILRNPSIVNVADGCALSIPAQGAGEAPVGLMLVGRTGEDHRLLRIGRGVEGVLGTPLAVTSS